MVKKTKPRKYDLKSIALKLLILVVLVVLGVFSYIKILEYRSIRNQVDMSSVRQLIITANENLKQPAVVDAKTGDKYFPPDKLYLPFALNQPPLIYSITDNGSGGTEFTISNKFTQGALSSKLYSAENLTKMFEQIPEFQACSRGITVKYEKLTDETNYNLSNSHILNNGKTVYLYTEKSCTQLNDTVEILKNLQSF